MSDIFNDKQEPQAPSQPTSTTPEVTLEALVGEGKKYSSIDDLAKAYINADGFIEQLKAENRELRGKVEATKTIDDVLERLQQQQTREPEKTDPVTGGEQANLSASEVTKLVEQTVTGLETARTREANIREADRLMKEAFGDKATQVFREKATNEQLVGVYMELAAASPAEFVKLFGVGDALKSNAIQDRGTVNTAALGHRVDRKVTPGTKEYYDQVRREDPNRYYSAKFQVEMDKTVRSNPTLYYGS